MKTLKEAAMFQGFTTPPFIMSTVATSLGLKKPYSLRNILGLVNAQVVPIKRASGFTPSINGLHFSNSYPSGTSYPFITLPGIGKIVSGDAGNGICGGFVYTVLDMFLSRPRATPPPDIDRPAPGSIRFNYLVNRLIDSFGSPPGMAMAMQSIGWIQTPSHEVKISTYGKGLRRRVVEDEWPKIKADIDSGMPSPLWLVMEPQAGYGWIPTIIEALKNCHQVLAYAYRLDSSKNLTLWVYDCNDPDNDSSTIYLNISDPARGMDINVSAIQSKKIRGFFRTDYHFKDP